MNWMIGNDSIGLWKNKCRMCNNNLQSTLKKRIWKKIQKLQIKSKICRLIQQNINKLGIQGGTLTKLRKQKLNKIRGLHYYNYFRNKSKAQFPKLKMRIKTSKRKIKMSKMKLKKIKTSFKKTKMKNK